LLHKTRGIVFRFTKYGETSIIVNIFTESFGLQSYIVNGVRSSSAKNNKIALYQPLTLIDLVVYHRENANINRIKEIKCSYPFQSIAIDVRKSTIAMFMTEVMNKSIKEQSQTGNLFEFLYSSIVALDLAADGVENFHLVFLLKLSRYLGFGAHNANEVVGGRFASEEIEKDLDQLMRSDFENLPRFSRSQRVALLELLITFFADHIDTFGDVKSIAVLREVMI
jgi:DNA repair protein RecO (recombination protein O)